MADMIVLHCSSSSASPSTLKLFLSTLWELDPREELGVTKWWSKLWFLWLERGHSEWSLCLHGFFHSSAVPWCKELPCKVIPMDLFWYLGLRSRTVLLGHFLLPTQASGNLSLPFHRSTWLRENSCILFPHHYFGLNSKAHLNLPLSFSLLCSFTSSTGVCSLCLSLSPFSPPSSFFQSSTILRWLTQLLILTFLRYV